MGLYRDHVMQAIGYQMPDVPSAEAMIHVAKRVPPNPAFEAEHGWRTDPPFPGLAAAPEKSGSSWRMICATRLYEGDREISTIYTTFVGGRPSAVVASEPGTWIPEEYLPLSSR